MWILGFVTHSAFGDYMNYGVFFFFGNSKKFFSCTLWKLQFSFLFVHFVDPVQPGVRAVNYPKVLALYWFVYLQKYPFLFWIVMLSDVVCDSVVPLFVKWCLFLDMIQF